MSLKQKISRLERIVGHRVCPECKGMHMQTDVVVNDEEPPPARACPQCGQMPDHLVIRKRYANPEDCVRTANWWGSMFNSTDEGSG